MVEIEDHRRGNSPSQGTHLQFDPFFSITNR
jgi:hypothetical protein